MKDWFNSLSNDTQTQVVLTVVSAIACSVSMIASGGATGIGWFIFAIILIW